MLEINRKLAYYSLIVLGIGVFTSVSFSALSHILLVLPAIYFTLKSVREKTFSLPTSSLMLIGLIITIIFSILTNYSDNTHSLKNLAKIKYFLIPILAVAAFKDSFRYFLDDKKVKTLIHLFVIITTIATISGLIGLWGGFNPLKFKDACHPTRACGLYGMYMTYGYGISLFVILLIGAILNHENLKKYISKRILTIALLVNGAGLYLSFARGGWLGVILIVPFFFIKNGIKKILISGLGIIVIGGLLFLFVPQIKNTFLQKNRLQSNQTRLNLFKTAFYAFKEKPIFGWGYRNFEPNVTKIKEKYHISEGDNFQGHAHNNFLEHLASTGIIGLAFFSLFVFFFAYEAYQSVGLGRGMVFPFVLSFTLSGQFQYTFGDGENLFLIMGVYMLFIAGSTFRACSNKDSKLVND